ncbi:hypothetical protein M422DRAFT_775899 [Sphaerobolus stellatus SS14]|nr:hypothetical protein M422DRAFT_775899 [Sphaerobolus stellatus SS14]
MLAATFSRFIPRSPGGPGSGTNSPSSSKAFPLSRSPSTQAVESTPRKPNRDRLSKAFTNFSLGSFGRPKAPSPGPSHSQHTQRGKGIVGVKLLSTKRSFSQILYVDEEEEYGIDDEEIRMPSELGSPASMGEFNSVSMPNILQPRDSEETYRDDDEESLVEIRPPSGLGTIKLTGKKQPGRPNRITSTYPNFYLELFKKDTRTRRFKESSFSLTSSAQPPNFSAALVNVLPVLVGYLEKDTLATLTLVDKAVGRRARELLWRRLDIALNESSKELKIGGQLPSRIANIVSSRDLASLVETLDLECKLIPVSRDPLCSRLRPPPLVLVPKAPNATRTGETIIVSGGSAPSPSIVHQPQSQVQAISEKLPPNSGPRRRTSLLRKPSLSLGAGVPEALKASAAKLSKRISQLTLRPLEDSSNSLNSNVNSDANSATSSRASTPNRAFHLPSRIQETSNNNAWTPPAEWERVQSPEPHLPTFAHAYGTALSSPPSAWASDRLPSPADASRTKSRNIPSLPSHQPNTSTHSLPRPGSVDPSTSPNRNITTQIRREPELRTSPSLPILRTVPFLLNISVSDHLSPMDNRKSAAPSPITPSETDGQMSGIPTTPHTPLSAISLSAFPLPPSSTTSPAKSGKSGEGFLSMITVENQGLGLPKEYMVEPREVVAEQEVQRKDSAEDIQHIISEDVKMVFKALVNLENVNMEYIWEDNVPLTLVGRANESLAQLLADAHSLERLIIKCPAAYIQCCQTQWAELKVSHSLKFLQVIVNSNT